MPYCFVSFSTFHGTETYGKIILTHMNPLNHSGYTYHLPDIKRLRFFKFTLTFGGFHGIYEQKQL